MAIKAIVDDINEVDEKYRDLYTQKGDKWELTGVTGFKTQGDIDRLQTSLTNERAAHAATKSKFAPLAEFDLNEVVTKLDRYAELEASAGNKLDEAGIQKLVDARLNTVKAPLERELNKAKQDLVVRDQEVEGYKSKEKQRKISDAIRVAAVKLKVQESAIEDAIMLGERSFEVTEEDRIITRDGIGVTPGVEAETWLTDMQAKRPHWWGTSQGGGANGSRSTATGAENPWSDAHWNMTKQGQIFNENASKAEQMAKAAGTSLGGPRPPKK